MNEWSESLAADYLTSRKKMAAYQRRLTAIDGADPSEVTTVNSMVSEMAWVIDWLRTGHQPGLTRGIDSRGAYRSNRRVVLDEDLFPSLQEPPRRMFSLSTEQREEALAAIRSLSDRELYCLRAVAVEGLSLGQIAEKMKLSKNTVRVYVDRAKKKIPGALTV